MVDIRKRYRRCLEIRIRMFLGPPESGSISQRYGSTSISQRYGSADPDPYQNVMNLQHWYFLLFFIKCLLFFLYGWLPWNFVAILHFVLADRLISKLPS